jgi:hypothetical protein
MNPFGVSSVEIILSWAIVNGLTGISQSESDGESRAMAIDAGRRLHMGEHG